eukprot:642251-Pleurochrysis_carterae.AAC.1
MCLEPTTKRIYVSPQARFIETSFPGLTNPTPPVPIATPPVPYAAPPAAPTQMDTTDTNEIEDRMLEDVSAPSPPQDETDPQQTTDTNNDTDSEGTIAERILRRRRQTAAVVATDLLDKPASPFV